MLPNSYTTRPIIEKRALLSERNSETRYTQGMPANTHIPALSIPHGVWTGTPHECDQNLPNHLQAQVFV